VLSSTQFVSLCFALLVGLSPVSFYLCWLAGVNRRDRPTVVGGVWDFASVLAALSGFLLLGGVLVLSLASSDPKLFTGGNIDRLKMVFEVQWLQWLVMLIAYAMGLGILVMLGTKGRRHWLAVYNLDADTAERAIEAALERSGLKSRREGDWWVRAEPSADGRRLVIAKTFHGTAHTTIRLVCTNPRQREEIERHLRSELAAVETGPGPAAPWFSSVAVGSVILVVGLVGLIAYFVFFPR
jgi:hypothetical protein